MSDDAMQEAGLGVPYTEPDRLPGDGSQTYLGVILALASLAAVVAVACLAIWWPA